MVTITSINSDIHAAVLSLDAQCGNIEPGLLFCDAFVAKIPSGQSSDELEFWYAIANLYGLFYDCAPYVHQGYNQFQRKVYASQKSKTLLEILCNNGCLTTIEKTEIYDYIKAIAEIRSCFCHNKPSSTFNRYKIQKAFGSYPGSWYLFPYLSQSGTTQFNFTDALNTLHQKTTHIFNLLSSAFAKLTQIINPDIIDEWSYSIVSWYLQSDDVIWRGLGAYYDAHPTNGKYHQMQGWRANLLDDVKEKSSQLGQNWTDFILDQLDDLAITVALSHTKATAEVILPDFFHEVLTP